MQLSIDTTLDAFLARALSVNPFLDNRVNGPSSNDADVPGIHQTAFERLTGLAGDALQTRRGIGAMLWGEAGIGKSHLLSRLARWAGDHNATFVYLHNLQAAPDRLPRSLLGAVVGQLTEGRDSGYYGTPLSGLVHAGLVEAVNHKLGSYSWEYLRWAWNVLVNRLIGGEHAGLVGADRHIFEVLFRFYYSAHEAWKRNEDGNVARWAVQFLSGLGLETDESRALGLPPPVPRDEAVALADNEQIKHVLVALSRLTVSRKQPFILAFDQVDNLDTDQASALSRFLEALIDAAPNLLVITAGVRATLFHWRQTKVIQDSSWDRLAQFEIELQRVGVADAGQLIRARLQDFFKPFDHLELLGERRRLDDYFPLGRVWYERQFKDKIDLRPRDAISQACEAWRIKQGRLRDRGFSGWLGDAPVTQLSHSSHEPEALDRLLDEKIAQLCSHQTPPQPRDGDGDDLIELLRAVLMQCRDADAGFGVIEVERAPLSKKSQRSLYDLSVLLRQQPDTPSVRIGLLILASTNATHVAGCLRRLSNEVPTVDRLLLITQEWIGLPLGERGKVYLTALQEHFSERFGQLELTWTEFMHLDALRTTAQLARGGDLEIGVHSVGEKEVLASHHRKDRYRSSRVLRKLLGQSGVANNSSEPRPLGSGALTAP